MRLRVHPALQLHFDHEQVEGGRTLLLEHLAHGRQFRMPSVAALAALDLAREWLSKEAYQLDLQSLGLAPARARRFVEEGLRDGMLEAEGGLAESSDIWYAANSGAAYRLRLARRHQIYLDYREEDAMAADAALMAAYRDEAPPPPVFKTYPNAERVSLERKDVCWKGIDHAGVSALMLTAFGLSGSMWDSVQGELLLKPHPSGGARHPLECYLACADVPGVARGLYHYSVRDHALDRVPALLDASSAEPALTLYLTAIPERVMWRYREPSSFAVLMLDVGHALENFATCCRAAEIEHRVALDLDLTAISRMLDLPSLREIPLAALQIGAVR